MMNCKYTVLRSFYKIRVSIIEKGTILQLKVGMINKDLGEKIMYVPHSL